MGKSDSRSSLLHTTRSSYMTKNNPYINKGQAEQDRTCRTLQSVNKQLTLAYGRGTEFSPTVAAVFEENHKLKESLFNLQQKLQMEQTNRKNNINQHQRFTNPNAKQEVV